VPSSNGTFRRSGSALAQRAVPAAAGLSPAPSLRLLLWTGEQARAPLPSPASPDRAARRLGETAPWNAGTLRKTLRGWRAAAPPRGRLDGLQPSRKAGRNFRETIPQSAYYLLELFSSRSPNSI